MKPRVALLVGLVLLGVLARLIPHLANFAPIGALALFGAAHFKNKWVAFLVPVLAMFASDAALEVAWRWDVFSGWIVHAQGFHQGMWVIYGTMVLIAALGLVLRRKKTVPMVAGTVLAGSILFFVVTNFAVWAMGCSLRAGTIPDNLIDCYRDAIPFFHWTLLGDACFATVLFGGFALAERRYPVLREKTAQPGEVLPQAM